MKQLLTILFLAQVMVLYGQRVNFEWAKQMGGSELVDARGSSTVTDNSGNIYSIGSFKGRVDFDPGPGVYNLDPIGTQDFYVSKLDPDGNFLWVKQMDLIGQFISAVSKSITVGVDGNILVTGEVAEIIFSPTCFVCKLDAAGNVIWSRRMGGPSSGTSIKTDAAGNVYVAGLLSGSVDLDPGPAEQMIGNALIFASSAFVCKLDINGNFVLAKGVEGYSVVDPGGGGALYGQITTNVFVAVDASQNIYVAGSFYGIVDFDPGVARHNLTEAGGYGPRDLFVLKLTAQGHFSWVKQMGGIDQDLAVAMLTDAFGNIYTAANFTGTGDFDPGAGVFNLNAGNGVSNTVISKLDANGNFIWAKQLTGTSQWCYAMTMDVYGNVYTTGYFGNSLDLDPGPGTYNFSSSGYDVFISKLNQDGQFVWARQLSGTATIISNSITIDILGNVVTTGYFFSGQVDFDPGAGTVSMAAGEGENIYVHKMSQCLANTSAVLNISVCKNYSLNGQTYTTSGIYTQTLINVAGCDSIVTLNLEIKPLRAWLTIATCNSYTFNNHIYDQSGLYYDTLATVNGCDSIITLNLSISPPVFTTITRSICEGETFEGYTIGGTYIDTLLAGNGCDSIVTLHLTVVSAPFPNLGADTSLCAGTSILLYPGKFSTYTWQDGSIAENKTVTIPGLYSVAVTNSCGSGTDEILIEPTTCDIHFPKAFTPNNDGLNDLFRILRPGPLTEFHLSIFNRWGQKVFETFEYTKGWDGSFNGQIQSAETFVWYCEFKKPGNAIKVKMKGVVTLLK